MRNFFTNLAKWRDEDYVLETIKEDKNETEKINMQNSEEIDIENEEITETPPKKIKKKGRILENIGILFLIMQFFAYFGGVPILGTNINFNKINYRNYDYVLSVIFVENFCLFMGVTLILRYLYINRIIKTQQ
jgi:hypothetical protein